MATKPIYTKRGDTEVLLQLNADVTSGSFKGFAKNKTDNTVTQLTVLPVDASSGVVAAQTAALEVGSYNLEVQVTAGGKIATYPDSGYTTLAVVQDLGD